jgi:endo-1,4-beta-xylanase
MRSLRTGLRASLLTSVVTLGALLIAAPASHAADTPLRENFRRKLPGGPCS